MAWLFHSKISILLFGIFALSLFIRTYQLNSTPVGLHVDEINAGYMGRYFFLNGHDIVGNTLPLYYDKFGDFRPFGIFYLSGLSTFLFGINSFAIRFPSAFFGALTVIPLYFLAKELFGKKEVGILAAFLLGLFPWHITLSRATSESIVGLFFFISGLYFFSKYIRTHKNSHFASSLLLLFLPYFLYHTYRFLTPLSLSFFLFYPIKTKVRKHIFGAVILFGFITMLFLLSGLGSGRLSQVAFYKNQEPQQTITYFTERDGPYALVQARIFHNKGVAYFRELLKQYGSYYSFQYLYINGGLPNRYSIPEMGLVPFAWIVFFIVGFIALAKDSKQNITFYFLIFLLLTAPLSGALTYEDVPNVQRSILLILPLTFFSSYGFFKLVSHKKRILLSIVVFLMIGYTYELSYFWHQYRVHAKEYKLSARSEGEKELVHTIFGRRKQYSTIVVPIYQEIPALYMFYTKNFTQKASTILKQNTKRAVLDGITFVDTMCPSREFSRLGISEKKILVVDSIECERDEKSQFHESGFVTVQTGDKAYRLLTN